MEKLSTIQKRENLNNVYVVDNTESGGACHKYLIVADRGLAVPKEVEINFQKGARTVEDSEHGILDTDLLEVVRHRLQGFQEGEFATRENAIALTHVEEALLWMNKRTEDRIERGVLGTMKK